MLGDAKKSFIFMERIKTLEEYKMKKALMILITCVTGAIGSTIVVDCMILNIRRIRNEVRRAKKEKAKEVK